MWAHSFFVIVRNTREILWLLSCLGELLLSRVLFFQLRGLPQYLPLWLPPVPQLLSPPQQVNRTNVNSWNAECKELRLPTSTPRSGGRGLWYYQGVDNPSSWWSMRSACCHGRSSGGTCPRVITGERWPLLCSCLTLLHVASFLRVLCVDEEPACNRGLWKIPVILHTSTETNLEYSALFSLSLYKYELGSSSEFCLVSSALFVFPGIRRLTFKSQQFRIISLL